MTAQLTSLPHKMTRLVLEDLRIILVDDDPVLLKMIAAYLGPKCRDILIFDRPGALIEKVHEVQDFDLVIADIRMEPIDGIQLLEECQRRGARIPFIFFTGAADVKLAVNAMRAGAVTLLEKPFDPRTFGHSIATTLQAHHNRSTIALGTQAKERLRALSPRQQQIVELICQGFTNKEIARELGMSFRTVESHRVSIMDRLEINSLAELVRLQVLSNLNV